jgi:hypothetical protein
MSPGPAGVVPKVKPLICPNCGGGIELRGFGQTVNAICGNCQTVLDTKTPSLAILQDFSKRLRVEPLIPLGSRGKWHGTIFEVIGFQVREIEADGENYRWSEYLLYNPYQGYRYLSEYEGHWNDGKTLHALPELVSTMGRSVVRYQNQVHKHFQKSLARTVFVLGEFPWQVRVGDPVTVDDYVQPPMMLSSEATAGEVVWSLSEYVPGQTVWQAFGLKGRPSPVRGVFANQPSPYTGKVGSVWSTFAKLMLMLFVLMAVMALINRNEVAFDQQYSFDTHHSGEASFVTPVFELKGHPSGVEVKVSTNLSNDWAYFNFALINEETGNAYDFGREVSYYFGSDSDGGWSEGSSSDSVIIPAVPAGRYYLRVEPEMDSKPGSILFGKAMSYEITVKRDVSSQWIFVIAFFLLFVPPIFVTIRAYKFEGLRWAESDTAPALSTSSSGGDDD